MTKQRIEKLSFFYVHSINLFIRFAKVEDLRDCSFVIIEGGGGGVLRGMS